MPRCFAFWVRSFFICLALGGSNIISVRISSRFKSSSVNSSCSMNFLHSSKSSRELRVRKPSSLKRASGISLAQRIRLTKLPLKSLYTLRLACGQSRFKVTVPLPPNTSTLRSYLGGARRLMSHMSLAFPPTQLIMLFVIIFTSFQDASFHG